MISQKASKASLTLSPSQWKMIQSLIYNTAGQQKENTHLRDWAKQIINEIETAKSEASRQSIPQVTLIMSPSNWKSVQTFLRPTGSLLKRDNLKEQKEKVIAMIQTAIDAARHRVIVTTGDLKQAYQVIGPVYFQVSNKGILSNALSRLTQQYWEEIQNMKREGQIGRERIDWGFLYGEYSAGQSSFERAFFVAVQELKKRAQVLDADAIISMRQDIDLDTNAFQFFYLQIYGTAVRFTDQ